jgi:hypothetical protein
MTIVQKIKADIVSPFEDIDVLNGVVHRLAVIYDEARLPGYKQDSAATSI